MELAAAGETKDRDDALEDGHDLTRFLVSLEPTHPEGSP